MVLNEKVGWCVGFVTDYNTNLRLHWIALGCGNYLGEHSYQIVQG